MTLYDFQRVFTPFVKALGVKVNPAQAEYFFKEFKDSHTIDFSRACTELAMGKAKELPDLSLFREYVLGAKEMRLEREKNTQGGGAQQYMIGHHEKQIDEWDELFVKCTSLYLRKVRLGLNAVIAEEAKARIRETLLSKSFSSHKFTWVTPEGLTPQEWLLMKISLPTQPKELMVWPK